MGKQLEEAAETHPLFFVLFLLFLRLFCSPLSSPIRFLFIFPPTKWVIYIPSSVIAQNTLARSQTRTHANKFPCEGGMRLKTYCTLVWRGRGLIKQLQCWNLKCCIYTRACDHTSMWEKKVFSHTRPRFPTTYCNSHSALFSNMEMSNQRWFPVNLDTRQNLITTSALDKHSS